MAPSGNHQEIRRVWLPVPTGEAGPRFRGPGVVRVRGAVAGSSAAGSVGPVPGDQRRDDDGSRPASDWQRQSTRARPNRAFGRRSEHAQCSPCWPKASFNVARSSAPGRLNHSEVSRHAVKHKEFAVPVYGAFMYPVTPLFHPRICGCCRWGVFSCHRGAANNYEGLPDLSCCLWRSAFADGAFQPRPPGVAAARRVERGDPYWRE